MRRIHHSVALSIIVLSSLLVLISSLRFRSQFEKYIRDKFQIPVVLIVVNGGPGTLDTVAQGNLPYIFLPFFTLRHLPAILLSLFLSENNRCGEEFCDCGGAGKWTCIRCSGSLSEES